MKKIEEIKKEHYTKMEVMALQSKLEKLQEHANGLGEIISNQTKYRFELEAKLEESEKKVKELDNIGTGLSEALAAAISDFENAQEKVKELEEKFQKHENEEIDFLVAKVNRLQSELSKWKREHDDEDLQDLKEQSKRPELACKQAYINGLEHKVRHLESRLQTLMEEVKNFIREDWIGR